MKNTAETHHSYSLDMACSGGKGKTWNINPFIKKDEQDLMAPEFLGGGSGSAVTTAVVHGMHNV